MQFLRKQIAKRPTQYLLGGALTYIGLTLLLHRYQRGPSTTYNTDLTGQVIIITGASAGIGKETARELAKRNATIIFACRNKIKTELLIQSIKKESNNQNLYFIQLDLSDLSQIKLFDTQFRKQFNKIDILINNAGTNTSLSNKPIMTKQGYEITFTTNHLGHFLLTNLLLDLFTINSRIINVSSKGHERVKEKVNFDRALKGGYSASQTYPISKYCNVLFTIELSKVLLNQNKQVKVVSLHPGGVRTSMIDQVFQHSNLYKRVFLRLIVGILYFALLNEKEGAMTTISTALMPYDQLQNAGYYSGNQIWKYHKNVDLWFQSEELWNWSQNIIRIQ